MELILAFGIFYFLYLSYQIELDACDDYDFE